MPNPTQRKCLNTALKLLTRRDHSCAELRQKLRQREYPQAHIDAVVLQCLRLAYLDDGRFAIGYLQSLRRRGYGRHRIRPLMKTKGVADTLIDATLEEHYPLREQYTDCHKALDKKLQKTAQPGVASVSTPQLFRFLQQRGFPATVIVDVLKSRNLFSDALPFT